MVGLMNDVAWVDQMLFHLINETWMNPLIDLLMPALSWIGKLGAVWIALLAALAIGFVLSTLIKDITMRPRPFVVLDHVRLLAAAISYSRLYVGVHWPTDVAAGVVLGLASGWAGFRLALRRWGRKARKQGPKSTEQPEDLPQVQSAS